MTEKLEMKHKIPKSIGTVLKVVRELLSIFIWLGMFSEIFIADIGDYLVSSYPQLKFAFDYSLLLLLASIAVFWLCLGNKLFSRTFGYILFYPFILLLWKIPKLLFKNWAVVIAFSPAIYHSLKAFKPNFIIAVAVIISAFLICLAPLDYYIVPVCMGLITLYLTRHFIHRFKSAYSSSSIFTVIRDEVENVWEYHKDSIAKKNPGGDPSSEEYRKKLGESLLYTYMLTTCMHFSIGKLQEVIKSRKMDLYFLSSLIWTFVLSAIIFGLFYYGLFRIDNANFLKAENAGVLEFIGFSFSTLMTSSISTVVAASGVAQIATYVQLFVSLLLIVLLVFIILTSIREKYKEDLQALVLELKSSSEKSKQYIESNYELTAEALEHLLIQQNEDIMKLMLGVRYGKDEAVTIIDRFKTVEHPQKPENEEDASLLDGKAL